MIDKDSVIIDIAFKKEIGIDINSALALLVNKGISLDDIGKITDVMKKSMADEVEKRNIPFEYRFLLINAILCTMFKTTVSFHKEYMKSLIEIDAEKDLKIDLVKDR